MNKTQEKGRRWLCSNLGFKPAELEYTGDAPTFMAKDGRGFLVKYALPGNVARFYPHEIQKVLEDPEKNNVVIVPRDGEIRMMPARLLAESPDQWGEFRLTYAELGVQGNHGEIVLKLSKRTAESRHHRINYLPMDSLLVWPEGNYEVKKSADSGKLGFFLVLRPAIPV